jgi:hypothetical protein
MYVTLKCIHDLRCYDAGSLWRIKRPCSVPRPALKVQNFPGISDLLSEVSKVQHRTKLGSKYITFLVSSLNLSPIFWWKESVQELSPVCILLLVYVCWSQWPRGLRPRFAAAWLLGLGVRKPPGAWMFVSCECCVFCQVEVSASGWSLVQRSRTQCRMSNCVWS